MIVYKCDKCGKIFDWYECCYHDKKFNSMTYPEMQKWIKENPDANYWESPKANAGCNAIQLMYYDPINDNTVTCGNRLNGEIIIPEDGNYPLITLCADCMSDLLNSIERFWDDI